MVTKLKVNQIRNIGNKMKNKIFCRFKKVGSKINGMKQ